MSTATAVRTVEVRHLQLARAALAAVAAAMITFSPDHSAAFGLAVFSGFAVTSALVMLIAAWIVHPSGARWPAIAMGGVSLVAGMVAGLVGLRSTTTFFVVVIAWAALTGIVETAAGARSLRAARAGTAARFAARDGLTIGILTLILAVGLALVPSGYALQYYIQDAGRSFVLTGTSIGVGVLGAYAAVIAIYLAIAGLSPRVQSVGDSVQARPDEGAA